ncbi:MAG: penicillin-binding protein 2 [Thermomicrobiales bacterium]|nr:penicillin-binding protein 2 [Thermomicrobiales bacterium]
MSHYHSIYATQQRRPSRWPWVLLVLLVIAISATTGALIAQGETPSTILDRVSGSSSGERTPETNVAVLDEQPTATATTAPAPTSEPTPEPSATAPIASTDVEQASVDEAAPTEETVAEVASLASPSAGGSIPVEDPTSPVEVVRAYGERWAAGDYGGLYDLLTDEAQATIPRQDFIDRYAAIQAEAGLLTVSVTVTGEASLDSRVPISVAFTSSKVGEIVEENSVQLAKVGDEWEIAWTPSLIFAELGDGCVDFTAESVRRGSILDRNGEPLAYDGTINVVGIVPGMLENENATISTLSKLIGMTTKEIKEKYQDGNPDWFMPVKTYPSEMDEKILNGIGQLQGVAVRTESARIYPLGAKAAHITGYVTRVTAEDMEADTEGTLAEDDWIGRAGLEAGAEELLTGTPGGRLSVVDCDTRVERSSIAERRAVPPQDIVLTIDKDFQIAVDDALGDVQGSAVIVDPRNGAILAMASHPAYDPNWFVMGFTDEDWAFVTNETKRPLLNRALEASYPTGSIFKVITTAAAMKDLGYTGETLIDCPQQWSIPGTDQIWKDWTFEEGLGAQGTLSLHWALVNSCNTVFYQIGNDLDKLDENALPAMAKAFGLGAPTDIPYLAEVSGIVPDPEWKQENLDDYWARGDAVNLSIGQGYLEATPLQMANAYAAIANNGKVLRPFIVEFTQDGDGSLTRVGKRRVLQELPLDNAQISEIQSALRDQTSNGSGSGSARVFGDFGWQIAGKTGTAQNQMTRDQKPHSWFAAFGPYGERATIASIVMVESSGEGVSFAAPRTRTIYEAYLQTNLAEESSKS